jgi:DNA repair photolyase
MINPIYKPKGAAGEYGEWALNIYTGCPHRCFYCYAPKVLRIDKGAFHSRVEPREGIIEAVNKQLFAWRKSGVKDRLIFLCFTCDPYPMGYDASATREIIELIKNSRNRVKILTKGLCGVSKDFDLLGSDDWFGISDDGVSGNYLSRRELLEKAKSAGINAWISFEPMLDVEKIIESIGEYKHCADLMAFGALNHVKPPRPIDYANAAEKIIAECEKHGVKYLIKSSLKNKL